MIVVTIALIHLVWDIECRELVIGLPAPMVRAEKVLFEWHDCGGLYGVCLLINSIYYDLSIFSTNREACN